MTDGEPNQPPPQPSDGGKFCFCLVCFLLGTAVCDLAQAIPLLSVYAQTQTAVPSPNQAKGQRSAAEGQTSVPHGNLKCPTSLHFVSHPPVTKRWRRIGYNYSLRYSTQQRAGTLRSATDGDGNTHCLPFRVDTSILHYGKECSSFQLNRPLIVRHRARACSLRCSAPLTTAIAYAPRVTVRKISARKNKDISENKYGGCAAIHVFRKQSGAGSRFFAPKSPNDIPREHCASLHIAHAETEKSEQTA